MTMLCSSSGTISGPESRRPLARTPLSPRWWFCDGPPRAGWRTASGYLDGQGRDLLPGWFQCWRAAGCLSLAVNSSQEGGVVALSSAVDGRQPSRVAFPAGTVTVPGQSLADTVIVGPSIWLLVFVGLARIVATTVFAYRRLSHHQASDGQQAAGDTSALCRHPAATAVADSDVLDEDSHRQEPERRQ